MTTDTPDTYYAHCTEALGQEAHNPAAVVRWCFDHPPRKAIPKLYGERSRQVWISRKTWQCLKSMAIAIGNGETQQTTDGLADALLALAVKDSEPALWNMHERHEQEEQKLIAELRRNEPELQKEDAPFDQIPR